MSWLPKIARIFRRPDDVANRTESILRGCSVSANPVVDAPSKARWEIFVSYASENRATAGFIADELQRRGMRVWFDQFEIKPGEPFADRILQGLDNSDCAAIVLCPRFLQKDWTRRELDILLTIEDIEGRQIVILIAHKIQHAQLESLSPVLAARTAIDTMDGLNQVPSAVIEIARSRRHLSDADKPNIKPKPFYPRFRAIGILKCTNARCTWKAPQEIMNILFTDPGPEFSFEKRQGLWYIVCDACSAIASEPITGRDAKKILALVRGGGIFAPDDHPYE